MEDDENGKKHHLVGKPYAGSTISSCKETKTELGGGMFEIRREFRLRNGGQAMISKTFVESEDQEAQIQKWNRELVERTKSRTSKTHTQSRRNQNSERLATLHASLHDIGGWEDMDDDDDMLGMSFHESTVDKPSGLKSKSHHKGRKQRGKTPLTTTKSDGDMEKKISAVKKKKQANGKNVPDNKSKDVEDGQDTQKDQQMGADVGPPSTPSEPAESTEQTGDLPPELILEEEAPLNDDPNANEDSEGSLDLLRRSSAPPQKQVSDVIPFDEMKHDSVTSLHSGSELASLPEMSDEDSAGEQTTSENGKDEGIVSEDSLGSLEDLERRSKVPPRKHVSDVLPYDELKHDSESSLKGVPESFEEEEVGDGVKAPKKKKTKKKTTKKDKKKKPGRKCKSEPVATDKKTKAESKDRKETKSPAKEEENGNKDETNKRPSKRKPGTNDKSAKSKKKKGKKKENGSVMDDIHSNLAKLQDSEEKPQKHRKADAEEKPQQVDEAEKIRADDDADSLEPEELESSDEAPDDNSEDEDSVEWVEVDRGEKKRTERILEPELGANTGAVETKREASSRSEGNEDPESKEVFNSLEEVKEAYPTFAKIMGVWVAREKKQTYRTPLAPIKSRRPKSAPAGPSTYPGFASMTKKWEKKLVEGAREQSESPPSKLRNVFAEKIDFGLPFEPPVHQKSAGEAKLIEDTVEKNFGFKDLTPDEMAPLVDAFERKEYEKGTTIGEEGEEECVYSIVQSGEVSFHAGGDKVGSAGVGESFGELSLLYSCPRPAEVKAAAHQTVLFQIDQTNFRHIIRDQRIRSEQERLQLLKSVDIFKEVSDADLRQLGSAMVPHKFNEGDNLSATFAEAPFCLVQQGSVSATNSNVELGQSFGEETLLDGAEHPKYEVKAATDGLAFTIDRESFEKVFGDFERAKQKFWDKQTLLGIKQIKQANLTDDELDTLVRQVTELSFEAGSKIFDMKERIKPTLYLVRKGMVHVVRKGGREEIITAGGYFGREYMTFTSRQSQDVVLDFVDAKSSATAVEDTVCGIVTLQEVAVVSNRMPAIADLEASSNIPLEALVRHRILGEGQFGTVWLVSEKEVVDPDPYALKTQYLDDPDRDAAECIRAEIKMMRLVQHPFVIQVLNTYEEEESISMLLSLAPGGELFDVLHRQDEDGWWISGLEEHVAKFYAAVVADTLAFLHRKKFVYRDLKPENVLIDKDGYPMITDFGFVKKLEEGKTYTFCGTPNYISPEVVTSRGHDMSCDNWSLGVMIYELIDGANPFWEDGIDQQTLYELICYALYPPITEGKCSAEAHDLIDRLLEREPSERLGTFREKDILEHPWFDEYSLDDLRRKKIRAPWIPAAIRWEDED